MDMRMGGHGRPRLPELPPYPQNSAANTIKNCNASCRPQDRCYGHENGGTWTPAPAGAPALSSEQRGNYKKRQYFLSLTGSDLTT